MTTKGTARPGHATTSRRAITVWGTVLLLLAGCSTLGPPPMEPLTETSLAAARQRWEGRGSDTYRLVVRVRPPRAALEEYVVTVAGGALVEVVRNGTSLGHDEATHHDYSMAGLFELLREDLRWTAVEPVGDVPAIDVRAYFDSETGRLVRYRRTVGTSRRRVLLVEVLAYEPAATLQLSSRTDTPCDPRAAH